MDGCTSTRDFEPWATRKDGDTGSNARTPGDLISNAYPARACSYGRTRTRGSAGLAVSRRTAANIAGSIVDSANAADAG